MLWRKIKDYRMSKVACDYYSPSGQFVPKEKHLQSKKETFAIEG
jgi:hypothetical protein